MDVRGYLESRDPETGDLQWRWYTSPVKMGDPGSETWPTQDAMDHGGGMTWIPGTYDPESEPDLLGHGQRQSGICGAGAPGRQSVDRVDRGAESGYRQAGVVVPGVAARHARLGQRGDAGALRRRDRRAAAQAAGARRARRMVLRARPDQRQEPGFEAVLRHRQLGQRRGRQGPADSRPGQGAEGGRVDDRYARRWAPPTGRRRATIRRPSCST